MTVGETEKELGASRHLLQVTERELQRLLLDIHDGPVQHMYAALSQLDLLRQALDARLPSPENALHGRVDRIRRLLEHGLTDIRSFLGALRPPEFEGRSLRELMEELVMQHETDTDTEVSFVVDEPVPAASVPVKIALFRVLQEALSNAYRHGGARSVIVRLGAKGGAARARILLAVEDDGAGFDPATKVGDDHFGLAGMRYRAELVGGTFNLRSAPGAGTHIMFDVPAS